jgi:hypothetical protein
VFLAVLVGGLGGVLFLLLNTITEGGFIYNIITANVNEFGWERLQYNLSNLWDEAGIILLLSGVFLLFAWRSLKSWMLLGPFLVGAFISALTIGKIGSNINYFLELTAALSLIGGAVVIWTKQHPWRYSLVILLITIQLGMLMQATMNAQVGWILTTRRSDFTALQALEQIVLEMDDPVPADEYMGLLTMHDRPLYIQPFEVSQLANEGMWDQEPFLADIQDQRFDGILIHNFGPFPVHRERWTPEMLAAIEKDYRPTKTLAGTVIFTPQRETGISRVPSPIDLRNFEPDKVVFGQIQSVTDSSRWAEPDISVNPNHPEHVAVIGTQASQFDCQMPNCKIELWLFVTQDGGETWTKSKPFNAPESIFYNGLVDFSREDTLYTFGTRNNTLTLNSADLASDYQIRSAGREDITSAQVAARPWFRVHPENGVLYVSMDAQEADMLYVTPSLIRSQRFGTGWSTTSRADLRVAVRDFNNGRAVWPDDIQVLFGEGQNLSLIWTWDWEPWTWPRMVWMANSTDGGVSFGEPTPILDTWGPINSTSSNGVFAIAYRAGTEETQQIAVAVTSDNGQTWESSIASGDVPLYFDIQVGPGIGMTPNGDTVDLVFYAHDSSSLDCVLDLQTWQERGFWEVVDTCRYNAYYTYSQDGGDHFSIPVKLNKDIIDGESFARFEGSSMSGSHLAVASSDEYAYPVWIETPGVNQTQVHTVQIQR